MHAASIADLEQRLRSIGDDQKRQWWSNYVKGAQFIGVPMADVRSVARTWFRDLDAADPIGLCLELGGHPLTEMKLSGVAIMEHELIPAGVMDVENLERIAEALHVGAYDDWNTCDWLCVKVIGRLVDGASHAAHTAVLSWVSSDVLWKKRAGLVGFVNLLPKGEPSDGFDLAFLSAASTVVEDDRRFAQTAAGWTLRELSRREPGLVKAFLGDHADQMSKEARSAAGRLLTAHIS